MNYEIEDVEDLKKKFRALVEIVKGLDEHIRLSDKIQADAQIATRKELDLINKNQRFLFEKLLPVFKQAFPEDWKYHAEFEKILGTEVGPEEPKKRP